MIGKMGKFPNFGSYSTKRNFNKWDVSLFSKYYRIRITIQPSPHLLIQILPVTSEIGKENFPSPVRKESMMRKADICLAAIGLLFLTLFLLLTVGPWLQEDHHRRIEIEKHLVAELGLTDLSLFTEARYTRHLSQADSSAAFQDHPRAMEHFPSGSMVLPPVRLWVNSVMASDFLQENELRQR
jgi:hypothetical protein